MTEVKLGKDAVSLPVGTEAERPSNPVTGMIRWNADTDALEGYDGVEWAPISSVPISATGGTISDVTIGGIDYRIHAFTSTGTSTFEVVSLGTTNGEMDVLVVGGGGGGGGFGGGGGAGGVVDGNIAVSPGSYTIQVGAGGPGDATRSADNTTGFNGDDSEAFNLTAIGGGGGGSRDSDSSTGTDGNDGGSGGGGGHVNSPPRREGGNSIQQTFANATSYGNSGGAGLPDNNSDDDPDHGGGGGGGAAEPGDDAVGGSLTGGSGGNGIDLSAKYGTSFGENGVFGGGGGGMVYQDVNYAPPGGNGGGGNGGSEGTSNATDGQTNTGGGGGGGAWTRHPVRGDGGSGIVLIQYRI